MRRWWPGLGRWGWGVRFPTSCTRTELLLWTWLPRAPTWTANFCQKVKRYSEQASEQMWQVHGVNHAFCSQEEK